METAGYLGFSLHEQRENDMKRNRDKISLWKRKRKMSDVELMAMLRNSYIQQQPAMPQWVQEPQPTTAPQTINLGWFGAIVGALR